MLTNDYVHIIKNNQSAHKKVNEISKVTSMTSAKHVFRDHWLSNGDSNQVSLGVNKNATRRSGICLTHTINYFNCSNKHCYIIRLYP